MKKIILILCVLSTVHALLGQNKPELRGVVLDEENSMPIPYANVVLPAQSIGTATNNDGDFVLKAAGWIASDTLVVSSIGYESKKVALDTFDLNQKLFVRLKQSVTQLEEVVVKPLEPMTLIQEAWNKISENYRSDPMMMKGFYRETVQLDESLISLAEAVISIYKSPYLDNQQIDQMKLLKGRKSKSIGEANILDYMSLSGGLQVDFIKYGLHPLFHGNFKYYDYEVEDILSNGEDITYVISFDQKVDVKLPLLKGKLYMDASSLAFVAVDYDFSPRGIQYAGANRKKLSRKQKKAVKKLGFTIKVLSSNTKVNFVKKGPYWYLQSGIGKFKGKVINKKGQEQSLSYRAELVITARDNESVAPIPKEKRLITFGMDLEKQIGADYDQDFWKEYNYLLPNEVLMKLSKSLLHQ